MLEYILGIIVLFFVGREWVTRRQKTQLSKKVNELQKENANVKVKAAKSSVDRYLDKLAEYERSKRNRGTDL